MLFCRQSYILPILLVLLGWKNGGGNALPQEAFGVKKLLHLRPITADVCNILQSKIKINSAKMAIK